MLCEHSLLRSLTKEEVGSLCVAWNMNVMSGALATILCHKDKGHHPRIREQKTGRLDP